MERAAALVGTPASSPPGSLPNRAGVSLKPQHYDDILTAGSPAGFFEVHAENYMGAGGPPHAYLARIRRDWPLSIHGVGLSIGGAGPLDEAHLDRLAKLCAMYQPESFSEHLAWSSHGGHFYNDLLPLPYDDETLALVAGHVDRLQTKLGRRMLLENPATYVAFETSHIAEIDFLAEVARRTGCGLLFDVNNVYVSANNHGFDPAAYIDAFPVRHVGEIHLAGHSRNEGGGPTLLIDSHGAPVADAVWRLFERALARTGPVPVLVEWDNDVPDFPTLCAEAEKAETYLARIPEMVSS
jgi:uncharacterized protein (UPF0276 family)